MSRISYPYKRFKYAILPFIIILNIISTSFKPADYHFKIDIRISNILWPGKFKAFFINGDSRQMAITMLKCDSVYTKEVLADPAYPAILKTGKSGMSLSALHFNKVWDTIDSLYNLHSRHIIATIKISRQSQPEYMSLIDSVLNADSTRLIPKDKRSMLDGTDVTVKVSLSNKQARYYANSPETTSHPLLYSFLSKTATLFGQKIYR